jgi:hypothetical protein
MISEITSSIEMQRRLYLLLTEYKELTWRQQIYSSECTPVEHFNYVALVGCNMKLGIYECWKHNKKP